MLKELKHYIASYADNALLRDIHSVLEVIEKEIEAEWLDRKEEYPD